MTKTEQWSCIPCGTRADEPGACWLCNREMRRV